MKITLMEWLIALFVLFILVAAATHFDFLYHEDMNRARQLRTLSDMRWIAIGMGEYAKAHDGRYPITKSIDEAIFLVFEKGKGRHFSGPMVDGWKNSYFINSDGAKYLLISYGSDKKQGDQSAGKTKSYTDDIVLSNGVFIRYPESFSGRLN